MERFVHMACKVGQPGCIVNNYLTQDWGIWGIIVAPNKNGLSGSKLALQKQSQHSVLILGLAMVNVPT